MKKSEALKLKSLLDLNPFIYKGDTRKVEYYDLGDKSIIRIKNENYLIGIISFCKDFSSHKGDYLISEYLISFFVYNDLGFSEKFEIRNFNEALEIINTIQN